MKLTRGPVPTLVFMGAAEGPALRSPERSHPASWTMESPEFAVTLRRRYVYAAVGASSSNVRVCCRLGKSSSVRWSSGVHVVPSFDPSTVQVFGSRPAASSPEVIVYATNETGSVNSYRTQPVDANASHLVPELPSARFAAPSLGRFCALAVTPFSCPRTLPGRPAVNEPTFACQGAPSRSATVVGSAAGSPDSNEDEKSPGSAAAAGAAARAPAGAARGTPSGTASAAASTRPRGRARPLPDRATARPGGSGLVMPRSPSIV